MGQPLFAFYMRKSAERLKYLYIWIENPPFHFFSE